MSKSPWKVSGRILFGATLCLAFSAGAVAQQVESAGTRDQTSQQLLERISQLEAKVKQLEEKQATAPSPEPAPEPVVEAPRQNMVAPRLKLNVFGDLGYRATDRRNAISNSFYIGSLDLFMASRLSDRVSMLGELLFISNSDNSIQRASRGW